MTSSFLYHYARLIEIIAGLERVKRYVDDPELSSTDLRADAGINRLRGVGVSETPRGTLAGGFWQRCTMPRKLRIEFEGAIYHVMNRGDRREPIFRSWARIL